MKLRLLSLLAMGTLVLTAQSATELYSLDDIFQGATTIQVHERLTQDGNKGTSYGFYNCYDDLDQRITTFTRTGENTVRIDDVANTGVSFEFTLALDDNRTASKGTRLVYKYVSATSKKPQTLQPMEAAGYNYSTDRFTFNMTSLDYVVLKIRRADDGTFYFTTPRYIGDTSLYQVDIEGFAYRSSGNNYPNENNIFLEAEYVVIKPNATGMIKRTLQYKNCQVAWDSWNWGYYIAMSGITKNPSATFAYDLELDYDLDNGRFSILNFANYGLSYDYAEIWEDTPTRHRLTGSIDEESGTITFDPGQYALSLYVFAENMGPWYKLPFRLMSLTNTNITQQYTTSSKLNCISETLTGHFTHQGVSHNNAAHGFVTHGGQRRTQAGLYITIDQPFTFAYTDSHSFYNNANIDNFVGGEGEIPMDINWHHIFEDATISGGVDVTLETGFVRPEQSLKMLRRAAGDNSSAAVDENLAQHKHTGVYKNEENGTYFVVPVINTMKNERYVDNYEIVCVPGTYEHADDMHAALGNAVAIKPLHSPYATQFSADSDNNGVYRPGIFTLPSASKEYTLSIKANYKPETGLTPTYHDLYAIDLSDNIQTGVYDLGGNLSALSISAKAGCIVIEGYEGLRSVHTAAGTMVYHGADSTVAVAPGVYIVTLDNGTAQKVIVR